MKKSELYAMAIACVETNSDYLDPAIVSEINKLLAGDFSVALFSEKIEEEEKKIALEVDGTRL